MCANILRDGVIIINFSDCPFVNNRNKPEMCLRCPWYKLCRGGCRRNRLEKQDGALGESYYCESYKHFFAYAVPQLEAFLKAK